MSPADSTALTEDGCRFNVGLGSHPTVFVRRGFGASALASYTALELWRDGRQHVPLKQVLRRLMSAGDRRHCLANTGGNGLRPAGIIAAMQRAILVSHDPVADSRHHVIEVRPGWSGRHATLSDFLSAEACRAIDDKAYLWAREWHRAHALRFATTGRVSEYPVTMAAIEYLRARWVLRLASERYHTGIVALDGVGRDWLDAARDLGLEVPRANVSDDIVPLLRSPTPTTLTRLLTALFASRASDAIGLFDTTPRLLPNLRHVMSRQRLVLVGPSRGALVRMLPTLRRTSVVWPPSPAGESTAHPEASSRGLDRIAMRYHSMLEPLVAPWRRQISTLPVLRAAIAPQDMTPFVRAGMITLSASGTPTLTLEHGIGGSYRHQVFSVASNLGVWGPHQLAYHRPRQPGEVAIHVVGSSQMEGYWAEGRRPDSRCRWDVIFFAQPAPALSATSWPEDHLRALRLVSEYARLRPHRRVAVKEHPAMRAYRAELPAGGTTLTSVRGDTRKLLQSCKLVVVVSSTAGLEAMAAGRPVVQIPPKLEVGETSFIAQSGAAVTADTQEEFVEAVDRLLMDLTARLSAVSLGKAYAAEFVSGIDQPGFSARRLAGLVSQLS